MHLGKAATGQRVLHPAQDYCRLCSLQGPALSHGQEPMDGPCLSPADSLSPVQWRDLGDLPVPFPPEVRMPEDSMGYPDLCIPQRRHFYLGPSHYHVPESCSSPPCYSWREVRACRWDWPVDPRLAPCACIWERHRDCGCSRQWYPPELPPHPFNGSAVSQLLPTKVRGQRYYTEARYVSEEHYWDCVSENYHRGVHSQEPDFDNLDAPAYNGHCERRHVRFQGHDDEISCDSQDTDGATSPAKTHCNGSPAFFSTEVPQSKFRSSRTSAPRPSASRPWGEEEAEMGQKGRLGDGGDEDSRRKQRKSQGTVREQIKQVVTELEDVLGGLKQVQLEMKEVVQQIDILTSNIDLGGEEQRPCNGPLQDPRHQGNRFGVVALVHNSNGDMMESTTRDKSSRPGQVKSRTAHSSSDHSIASVAAMAASHANSRTATKNHTNPSSPVHTTFAVESAGCRGMNHTSATESQRTKSSANGDCLRARPPRVRVKDLQNQRSRLDYVLPSKLSSIPEPSFPLTPIGLSKTQKPPPYPQNGQAKMPNQDVSHSSNGLKTPPYCGKQKQLTSTMV
ncbi:hypothetical protein AMEX_G6567 [Astyanax mexicanus]|uniref:Uncharacterized protein n=1 Tax=Astyanax mexicanus TaxID=7994 RepID=A0A8T2M221_ASTMX|nr:hypothetical protein AMEX_G6567 [Astyanax mexicanus]